MTTSSTAIAEQSPELLEEISLEKLGQLARECEKAEAAETMFRAADDLAWNGLVHFDRPPRTR